MESFDVRIRAYRPDGRPLQRGRLLDSVLGAAGYGRFGRAGELWHRRAFHKAREKDFREHQERHRRR